MAFSTQKDFLKIGFLNDCNDLNSENRRRYQVCLKTYTSCTDSRAWSLSQEKQTKYLTDLVACGTRFDDDGGLGSGDAVQPSSGVLNGENSNYNGTSGGRFTKLESNRFTGEGTSNKGQDDQGHVADIRADDSLIEAACMKLDDINAIIRENSILKKKLEFSKEKIERLDDENNKIKAIITDSAAGSYGPAEDEIKVLKAKGELNTDNVLKILKSYIEDAKVRNRKCDLIFAENESLKVQIEKLEMRVKISIITQTKQETSADINYLQSTVNDLRTEVALLRAIEEDRAKLKVEFDKLNQEIKHVGSPDDLYNMKRASVAIREVKCDRDRLRQLINSMVGIEDDLKKIKDRAEEATKLEIQVAELKAQLSDNNNPNISSSRIASGIKCDELRAEIDRLKKENAEAQEKLESLTSEDSGFSHAQEKLKDFDRVSCELQLYKIHYNELCNELRRVGGKLLQLEPELEESQRKLYCAECSISRYEQQMDDLMEVIRELEAERKKCILQLEQGSTVSNSPDAHIQDLLSLTKITISYIQKETEARLKLEEELKKCKVDLGLLSQANVGGSQEQFNTLLVKLQECESEAVRLKKENDRLLRLISDEDLEDLLDQLNACKRENDKLQSLIANTNNNQQFDELFGELKNCRIEKDKLNDIIQDLMNQLDECRKNGEIAALLHEKEDALKACQDRIRELEDELVKITEELESGANNCTAEIKKLRGDFEKEKADLQKKLADLIELQDSSSANLLSDLSKCRDDLQKLRDQLKEEAEQCQTEKYHLQQQVEHLKKEQKNLGQTGDTISENIKDLEKRLADCKSENEALQKERDSLVNKLGDCKSMRDDELAKLRKELDEKISQLTAANENMNKLISDLEQQKIVDDDCKKVKAAFKECQDNYKQLESRYDSLHHHDVSLQKTLDDLRKEYEAQSLQWAKELNEQKSLLEQAKSSLEAHRGEISRLNDLLKQSSCKDLEDELANLLAEKNNIKTENDKMKQSLKSKEDEIASLQKTVDDIGIQLAKCEESIKSTDCNKYLDEIAGLRSDIAKYLDENQTQASLLESVKKEIAAANSASAALRSELDKVKNEKDAANQALKSKEDEVNNLKAHPPRDDERLQRCLEDQKRLQEENTRLQEDFQQLENLVKDIEEERKKNKRLESLIEELDQKIKDLQSDQTTAIPAIDVDVQTIIDKLKDQLQTETDRNNALSADLQTCNAALAEVQGKLNNCLANLKELENCKAKLEQVEAQIKEQEAEIEKFKELRQPAARPIKPFAPIKPIQIIDPVVTPSQQPDGSATSIVKPPLEESFGPEETFGGEVTGGGGFGHSNQAANQMIASTISEIQNSHCANLEKMQKMYEERMKEIMLNHDKEIQALQLGNEALRNALMDLKGQIAACCGASYEPGKLDQINKELEKVKLGMCKCNQESDYDTCGQDKKLHKICTKILKTSIDCLSLRELKYLHCSVYRAGVKMKPMITTVDSDEMGRCCQCTGFVCSLPTIPKDCEKKFITRINCLENELENANDLLQRLKERYEAKSSCSRRCCTGHSERRAPPRGINDAVNRILKCAREGRRNSGC